MLLLIQTAEPAARAGSTRVFNTEGRAEESELTQESAETSTRSEMLS